MSAVDVLPTTQTVEAPQVQAKPKAAAREDLTYVRVIRAFALFIIVSQHLSFPLIYEYNTLSYASWWVGISIYMWGKAGSPLFTMVSGLLLLDPTKDEPVSVFFRKRFVKVLIPFIAWSAIYLLWRIYARGESFTPREILILFVQGPVYYHLWFIQMILGLYLATPILRIYMRSTNRDNLRYFLLVWFMAVSVIPIINRFAGFQIGIQIVVTTGFVGFYVLGYYLRPLSLSQRQLVGTLLILVAALLTTQFLTHNLTVRNEGTFDNFFALNDSFNIVIIAVGLFMVLKSLNYKQIFAAQPWLGKIVTWVSSTSLGIYFVHVLVIEELASGRFGFIFNGQTFHPLFGILVGTVMVMTISVIITMALQRIPVVRNIVP